MGSYHASLNVLFVLLQQHSQYADKYKHHAQIPSQSPNLSRDPHSHSAKTPPVMSPSLAAERDREPFPLDSRYPDTRHLAAVAAQHQHSQLYPPHHAAGYPPPHINLPGSTMLPPTFPPHPSDPRYAAYLHERNAAALYGAHRLPPSSSAHLASLMDNKAALLVENKSLLLGNGPLGTGYPGGRPPVSVYDPGRSSHMLDHAARQLNPFHGLHGDLPHHLRDPAMRDSVLRDSVLRDPALGDPRCHTVCKYYVWEKGWGVGWLFNCYWFQVVMSIL